MKNMEHFHEMKSLTRKQKFCLLSLIPAYFIVIGLVVQQKDSEEQGQGNGEEEDGQTGESLPGQIQ